MFTTTLNTLLDNSFSVVSDILDGDFCELGKYEEGIEKFLGMDADSVLIEDIKLDIDSEDTEYTISDNLLSEGIRTEHNKVLESEDNHDSDEKQTFSPLQRDRCSTWPGQMQERTATADSSPNHTSSYPAQALSCVTDEGAKDGEEDDDYFSSSTDSDKSSTNATRNPWGNSSYADLITMAIQTSPDRRLTLSQIYDWIVSAVPYFSERVDSCSSAGWKNSIRHNLSLHKKFLKVPNEDVGKSSWWSLNPENFQSKKPRRRATSGDLRILQTKREKMKKKVETLKRTPKLIRSSSTSLSPLNYKPTHEMFHPRANSTTIYTEGVFTSFRSRNSSGASSTAQESPLDLNEHPSHDFPLLDNISHKIKILEPRANPYFGKATNPQFHKTVLNQRDQSFSALSYVTPLHTRDKHEHDEVRKPMIIKQLNQLTQKRFEILQYRDNISVDNKKSLESTFDLKIMLLQDELNKLTREEEILKINQFSAASNNPYFSVYNKCRPAYSAQAY